MGPDRRRGTFSVRTAEAVDAFVSGWGEGRRKEDISQGITLFFSVRQEVRWDRQGRGTRGR